MNKELFFILVYACIITHMSDLVYEILKHKQVLKASKVSFVIIFINMIILWISWILLCRFDIFKISLPDIIRYLGISVAGVGIIAFLTGLLTIKTLGKL